MCESESRTVQTQQTVAGLYTASVSHWGVIDLSSFCLVQKVLLSPQVSPFQKPFCSHSTKAEMSPLGQGSQEALGCSWCLLCSCQQADGLPWNWGDWSFCPTHLACPTPSFYGTAVLHLQQPPWFKIAPPGHSDILKCQGVGRQGNPGTTEMLQNLLSRVFSSPSRRFMRLLF